MTAERRGMPGFSGPELCRLSASEAVRLLRRGEVGPQELLDAALSRIRAVEPAINAMPTVDEARARARLAEVSGAPRCHPGWLGGLAVAIKDLDRVAGMRTTFGTRHFADHVPERSETFVEVLEARGGLVVGKTNTPELGAGGNTFNDVFGRTRNPWDTRLNAGGSSGGAAAALAAGEVWLAQGSDHGGSLRTPAAYCGIVGLRPSPGRVPGTLTPGQSATRISEVVIGPMARSVEDCALFLDALAFWDPRQPASIPPPALPFTQAVRRASEKVRIAWAPDLGGLGPVEPAIRATIEAGLARLERDGAAVVEACPQLDRLVPTYHVLRALSFLAGPARLPRAAQRHFKQTIGDNIAFARTLSAEDVARAFVDATALGTHLAAFLEDFDALACPVVGAMPRSVEVEWVDEIEGVRLGHYMDWLAWAFLATVTGHPAISVPVGLSGGLPVGVQLIGRPRGEAALLAVARAVERSVGGPFGPIDPVEPPAA